MEPAQLPHSSLGLIAEQRSSAQVEELNYRGLDYEMTVTNDRGQEAYIKFSYADLSYSRTNIAAYQRLQLDPADASRTDTARTLLQQAAAWEHTEIQATSIQLEIGGDTELLAGLLAEGQGSLTDLFSAENTAQRIVDHAAGLLGFAGADTDSDIFAEIRRGIEDGFEQAGALLGGLPEISEQTHDLVDRMMSLFADRGIDGPRVTVADVMADEGDEPAAITAPEAGAETDSDNSDDN